MNDDGEPQGTAGRPIYGQIQSFGLTNIMVVVVRYFGGTLLGVAGLTRAYKQATIEAIANAEIVTRIVELKVEVEFEYLAMNSLMQLIKDEQLEIITSRFDLQCSVTISVRLARVNEIFTRITSKDGVLQCKIL
jgi:putative IMPACT (imprinted ancient) family translation regulator